MTSPIVSLVEPDLASRDFYSNPYPIYDYLRTHDPVHWSSQWDGWLLTRFKDVSTILRDSERFSNVGFARDDDNLVRANGGDDVIFARGNGQVGRIIDFRQLPPPFFTQRHG